MVLACDAWVPGPCRLLDFVLGWTGLPYVGAAFPASA